MVEQNYVETAVYSSTLNQRTTWIPKFGAEWGLAEQTAIKSCTKELYNETRSLLSETDIPDYSRKPPQVG